MYESEVPPSGDFSSFGVPATLCEAIAARGFERPTAVQAALLDPMLATRDVLVSSRTGSGKTVAYGLMLAGETRPATEPGAPPARGPRALVITPTRELAQQVRTELDWLLAAVGMRVLSVTGGTSVSGDLRALRSGCDVLVGTPGRINDHLTRGSLDGSTVSTVVLDEADEMLDLGFRDELETILTALPTERRTLMLSATMPPAAVALSRKYLREPVKLAVGSPEGAHEDIAHVAHLVHSGDKLDALVNLLLLAPEERTMVFVRTRADAADLASQLAELGFAAAPLTGEMQQRDRTQTLDAFRAGRVSALIATDVAARGIDVPEVTRVIHADLPGDSAALTHRSGRTGRAGRKGISVLLVPPGVRARATAILGGARVRATWKPVPGANEVRVGAEARLRARLLEAAAATEPGEGDARLRGLATQLLENRDPIDLVANLLREVKFDGPCAPRNVRPVEVKPARDVKGFRPAPRGFAGGGERDGGFAGRDNGFAGRDSGFAGRDGGFAPARGRDEGTQVLFRVNFGATHGATPSRLLAMVCRRGRVKGTDVGAIAVGERDSTFGVSRIAADSFARAVSKPDVREPHVRIEMARQRARG